MIEEEMTMAPSPGLIIYVPRHEMVKNIGLCVGKIAPEYRGGTYILAIHMGEDFVYPIYIGKTAMDCVEVGKTYICGIREGYKSIPLDSVTDPSQFGIQIRKGEIKIVVTEDKETMDATEELNNMDVKEEIQKECKEDLMENCHTCVSYIPDYNMCRKVVAPITDVKACTAYQSLRAACETVGGVKKK